MVAPPSDLAALSTATASRGKHRLAYTAIRR
jgi:hypothetical protein